MKPITLKLNLSGVIIPSASKQATDYDLTKTMDFGFFGGSGDPNKYYPEVNGSNIMPKEEDFIYVPFRLISATVVGAGSWKATNFSNEAVLKASMNKLLGKPIFTGHDQEMDNWVGVVHAVKWAEASYQDGQRVPAGIEAILAIDAKTNPKIARGVLLGAIFSNSVTVAFGWKPSHDFGDLSVFESKVGQMGEDGRMISREVTDIVDYYETSLVWLGADPFAKKVVDGKLVNIDVGNVVPLEKEQANYTSSHSYSIETAFNRELLMLNKQKTTNNTMNEFLTGLLVALGVTEQQLRTSIGLDATTPITAEHFKGKLNVGASTTKEITPEQELKVTLFDKLLATESAVATFGQAPKLEDLSFDSAVMLKKDEHTALVQAKADLGTTKNELVAEQAKVADLTPKAALGVEYFNRKQKEAIRLYKLAAGDKVSEAVVALFEKATATELDGLIAQNLKTATEAFGGHCKKCGSEEFSFQSSFTGSGEGGPTGAAKHVLTYADMRNQFEKEFGV